MTRRLFGISFLVAIGVGFAARRAEAHCDTLGGPVVTAGQKALDTADLDPARIWVQPSAEPELREAFTKALEVRRLGPAARALADRWFFETLVRLHRAGEGEPYTGLKPAGTDLGPAIPTADRALAASSVAPVDQLLTRAVKHGLAERLARVVAARRYKPSDVTAGRAWVTAYVGFLHYVEGVYQAATGEAAEGH